MRAGTVGDGLAGIHGATLGRFLMWWRRNQASGLLAAAVYALLLGLALSVLGLPPTGQLAYQRLWSGTALLGLPLLFLGTLLLVLGLASRGELARRTARAGILAFSIPGLAQIALLTGAAFAAARRANLASIHDVLMTVLQVAIGLDALVALAAAIGLFIAHLGSRPRAMLVRAAALGLAGAWVPVALYLVQHSGKWQGYAYSADLWLAVPSAAVAVLVYAAAQMLSSKGTVLTPEEEERLKRVRERYRTGGLVP